MHDLSIIIVTYNSSADIENCIHSLFEFLCNKRAELIIIDNASTDGTQNILRASTFKDSTIVMNDVNCGFAAACNQGARLARGTALYFCNPDTLMLNDVFSIAGRHLIDLRVGCVSPRVIGLNGQDSAFAFRFPHNPIGLVWSFIRSLLSCKRPLMLQVNWDISSQIIECDWVLGACLLIRRSVFEEVGGFDERYFLYFDDIDICKRIKAREYRVLADREATVCHKKYGSSRTLTPESFIAIRRASERTYYRIHYGILGYLLCRVLDRQCALFRS